MSDRHDFLYPEGSNAGAVLAHLRRLQHRQVGPEAPAAEPEPCDLCGKPTGPAHRHLLQTTERRILCACEACYAMRAGDPGHRPVGTRTEWLDDLQLSDALWSRLGIPVGLSFFFLSSASGGPVALYPSPAGATEAAIDPEAWREVVSRNPRLGHLEVDAEGLVVSRLEVARYAAILPIDRCYELVGRIKASWEGITGGPALRETVPAFFEALRAGSRR